MTATALSGTDEWRACRQLEQLFEVCFGARYQTRLCGGAAEPLYEPTVKVGQRHMIYYREDFFSSALHEIAHWCIAGSERRRQLDYGYWYESESRNEAGQHLFESVEVKPQAIEWHLALACGRQFGVSLDNLTGLEHRRQPFSRAVAELATAYCCSGMPPRALQIQQALLRGFGGKLACADDFRGSA